MTLLHSSDPEASLNKNKSPKQQAILYTKSCPQTKIFFLAPFGCLFSNLSIISNRCEGRMRGLALSHFSFHSWLDVFFFFLHTVQPMLQDDLPIQISKLPFSLSSEPLFMGIGSGSHHLLLLGQSSLVSSSFAPWLLFPVWPLTSIVHVFTLTFQQ